MHSSLGHLPEEKKEMEQANLPRLTHPPSKCQNWYWNSALPVKPEFALFTSPAFLRDQGVIEYA